MAIDKIVIDTSEDDTLSTPELIDKYRVLYHSAIKNKDENATFVYRELFKYYSEMYRSERIAVQERMAKYVAISNNGD